VTSYYAKMQGYEASPAAPWKGKYLIFLDDDIFGDGVNVAARLEGINKEFRTHICISHNVFKEAGERLCVRPISIARLSTPTKSAAPCCRYSSIFRARSSSTWRHRGAVS